MILHRFLIERPVESFDLAVLFRTVRRVPPMQDGTVIEIRREDFVDELLAAVGPDLLDGKGRPGQELAGKIPGILCVGRVIHPGKRPARGIVDGGIDDLTLLVAERIFGVHLDLLPGFLMTVEFFLRPLAGPRPSGRVADAGPFEDPVESHAVDLQPLLRKNPVAQTLHPVVPISFCVLDDELLSVGRSLVGGCPASLFPGGWNEGFLAKPPVTRESLGECLTAHEQSVSRCLLSDLLCICRL